MTKRNIVIILGALLLLVIIALAWWWLFAWSGGVEGPRDGFGSGDERVASTTGQGGTNIGTNLGGSGGVGQAGSGTNVNLGTVGPRGGSGSGGGGGGSRGSAPASGTTWLPQDRPQSDFSPSDINRLNDGTIGGEVVLFGTPPQPTSTTGLGTALTVAGIGTALCTAGLLPGVIAATGAATAAVSAPGVPSADVGARLQNVLTIGNLTNETIRENFLNCVTRTIARAAVQQLTASIVNWINSGFNGKPSFVQNYQQFFTNVADQAAGAYIQGSGLAFLCSPIQLKVRIALAQSYANRNAMSCTLTRAVNNINSFMNGNFAAGGWGGLLELTTVPTNNPFGAYSYAQIQLNNKIVADTREMQQRLSPGGFLSTEECTGPLQTSGPNAGKRGPPCRITTPGTVIQSTLETTLGTPTRMLEQAGISGSFDAIINALMQQLAIKTLQGGLSNLSGAAGYTGAFLTADQQQAQTQGNALLATLQGISNTAGQYGAVAQGSISDIQNTQQRLQELINCRESRGGDTTGPTAERNQLESRVAFYNDRITRANEVISLLQAFQTRVLQVATAAQVAAVQTDLNAAQAAGRLITAAEVTTAQQDRTTLQATLASTNEQTRAQLQQCNAS